MAATTYLDLLPVELQLIIAEKHCLSLKDAYNLQYVMPTTSHVCLEKIIRNIVTRHFNAKVNVAKFYNYIYQFQYGAVWYRHAIHHHYTYNTYRYCLNNIKSRWAATDFNFFSAGLLLKKRRTFLRELTKKQKLVGDLKKLKKNDDDDDEKKTMQQRENQCKRQFYLHLGLGEKPWLTVQEIYEQFERNIVSLLATTSTLHVIQCHRENVLKILKSSAADSATKQVYQIPVLVQTLYQHYSFIDEINHIIWYLGISVLYNNGMQCINIIKIYYSDDDDNFRHYIYTFYVHVKDFTAVQCQFKAFGPFVFVQLSNCLLTFLCLDNDYDIGNILLTQYYYDAKKRSTMLKTPI
nr:hypothetical protein [Microctonus hyperodae filamentous virus]